MTTSNRHRALRGLLIILSKEILGAQLHEADAVHATLGVDRDQSCALLDAWANDDLLELWRLGELYSDGELTLADVLAEQAQEDYTPHARLEASIARGADAAAEMEAEAGERCPECGEPLSNEPTATYDEGPF